VVESSGVTMAGVELEKSEITEKVLGTIRPFACFRKDRVILE
jgi:hypothetical protein